MRKDCPSPSELARSLVTQWQQTPPAGYATTLELISRPRVQKQSRSCLFRYDARAGEQALPLLVKVGRGPQAAAPQAEYDALQILRDHFASQPHLDVPAALLVLDDPPALVMRESKGRRLLSAVQNVRPTEEDIKRLGELMGQAGSWLAWLHRLPIRPEARPVPSPEQRFEQAWRVLQQYSPDAEHLQALANALQSRLPDLPDGPAVMLHGDMTLRNVMIEGETLIVLDTALDTWGPGYLDVASLVASLHYIDWPQMLSVRRDYPPAMLNDLEYRIATSYQEERFRLSFDGLHTAVALKIWERWAAFAEHLAGRLPRPLFPLVLRRLQRHFYRHIDMTLGIS